MWISLVKPTRTQQAITQTQRVTVGAEEDHGGMWNCGKQSSQLTKTLATLLFWALLSVGNKPADNPATLL